MFTKKNNLNPGRGGEVTPLRSSGRGAGGYTLSASKKRVAGIIIASTLLTGVGVASAPSSSAGVGDWIEDAFSSVFCGPESSQNSPQPYNEGAEGLGYAPYQRARQFIDDSNLSRRNGDPTWNSSSHTAYERYGMSGTNWSRYHGQGTEEELNTESSTPTITEDPNRDLRVGDSVECMTPIIDNMNNFANVILGGVEGFVAFTSYIYVNSINFSDFLSPFYEKVGAVITGEGGNGGLRQALFLDFLLPAIMIAALVFGYKGLINREFSEVLNLFLKWITTFAITMLILFNPVSTLKILTTLPTSLGTAAATGISSIGSGVGQAFAASDMCDVRAGEVSGGGGSLALNADAVEAARVTKQDEANREIECVLWKTFVFGPWSQGQFGVSIHEDLGNAEVPEPINLGNGKTARSWQLYQLEQQSMDVQSMAGDKLVEMQDKKNDWYYVRDHIAEEQPDLWSTWTGENPTSRLIIATLAGLVALACMCLVVAFSVMILMYGLFLAFLVLVYPFFGLIGMIPGWGTGRLIRWYEMAVSTVLKITMLMILLGIMMGFYAMVLASDDSFAYSTMVVIVVTAAAWYGRGILLNSISEVTFGGTKMSNGSGRGRKNWGLVDTATGAIVGGTAGIAAGTTALVNGKGGKVALDTWRRSTIDGVKAGAHARSGVDAAVSAADAANRHRKAANAKPAPRPQKAEEKPSEEK